MIVQGPSRETAMPQPNLSSLEDVILGFYVEHQAEVPGAVLPLADIAEGWTKLGLRDADLRQGLLSLHEAGMCEPVPQDAGLMLTGIGAEYLSATSLLGIRAMLTRRALRWNVERLRATPQRRSGPGATRRRVGD